MAITSTSASDWPNQRCTPCIDGYASSGGSSCGDVVSEPDELVRGPTSMPSHGSSFLNHESRRHGSNLLPVQTDVLWGAGCVSCASPVLTGGCVHGHANVYAGGRTKV